MAIKKSELYSSLWKSCDELRGGMDASQYKDYILVLLFMKYVSDKYAGKKDALLEVPNGCSFADMAKLDGDDEIGDKINKILAKLAAANDLRGVIDVADFDDDEKLGKGKEKVDKLSELVGIFDDLDFTGNRAEGDDLLGDAYEYLMRHFATESGKSKGQFYTPAEVSRIMAMVIGLDKATSNSQTIYDPTCGSGSLLLKAHDEAESNTSLNLALYGQENDVATAALAKMNMILHDCPTADIWKGNTLSAPHFTDSNTGKLKLFDFVVANFPFSTKSWSNGIDPVNDAYNRFEFGIPPKKNGDYAFLLHILNSLKSNGTGAVIHPHGVLFRGNVEADIRREIVRRGYIKGIIGLPPNLFYGTGIPACILILDKENAASRKGIFMIDASKGFIKDGNKNRLREQDIHKIVDTFTRQLEIPRYSRMVPLSEISDPKNDYNLNIPRYIDSTEPEDLHDLNGHLNGGIPVRDVDEFNKYWEVFPSLRNALYKKGGRKGYCELKIDVAEVKPTIFNHGEFTAFNDKIMALYKKWQKKNRSRLENIKIGDRPKALIKDISEDLLNQFKNAPLLNEYDMYQHLMAYWAETMQDDVYIIVSDGWKAEPTRILEKNNKGKEVDKGWVCDLVPKQFIVDRYFSKEQTAIEAMESDIAAAKQEMEEMAEEHGGDEGLLESAKNDKDNLTKTSLKDRLKEIKNDKDYADEVKVIEQYLARIQKAADIGKKVKKADNDLDNNVLKHYAKLTENDIKTLVIEDKWLTAIAKAVQGELDRVSQTLTGRVKLLTERYADPLPKLADKVEKLSARVEEHLAKMGATWK